mmetsp:Transcript_12767/g.51301  ORF Transcript_12767/g.51301 Transcript_12767/m.51301 type:complete len:220 (-) Transcript_12767:927-1586(-)|eukprot:CAMPEP_0113961508 /NCGR_PEP_ID=MMETSP0011_2-20120614/5349_1 /TAXON_ID=101924 /ORGANISM="Rhodosorus marinus" /LENGTH=219 /DNA_ID=CAMNT_0000973159 /DNA_START=93 /DNA_END=752 /DNA_ORIENTATION=- /assembly_acc=CAM_ASM_000156
MVPDEFSEGASVLKVNEGKESWTESITNSKWENAGGALSRFLEGELEGVTAGPCEKLLVEPRQDDDGLAARATRMNGAEKRIAAGLTNKRQREKTPRETAGAAWYDMPKPTMTPELEKDLRVLRMRAHLEPDRHYKSTGWGSSNPEFFQVGTVLDTQHDYLTGRITRRERKRHIKDELLSGDYVRERAQRRFAEAQVKSASGRNRTGKVFRPKKNRLRR